MSLAFSHLAVEKFFQLRYNQVLPSESSLAKYVAHCAAAVQLQMVVREGWSSSEILGNAIKQSSKGK